MAEVVDQRDVQRLGGRCALYPSSCVVWCVISATDSSPKELRILDVTYGEGRFYAAWPVRPALLIGADTEVRRWIVDPDAFIRSSVQTLLPKLRRLGLESFDVLVVDPPWGSKHRSRPQYNVVTDAYAKAILLAALRIADELRIPMLLVHYRDPWIPDGWEPIKEIRFVWFSRYLKQPGSKRSWYALLTRTTQ